MKKFLLSYQHTGVPTEHLEQLLLPIFEELNHKSVEYYCTYQHQSDFNSSDLKPEEIIIHALKRVDEFGALVVIVDNARLSQGMLLEIGYAIAKNYPIKIFYNINHPKNYFIDAVQDSHPYQDLSELINLIKKEI